MEPARQQLLIARRSAARRSAGRADLVVLALLALFALMVVALPAAWLFGSG